MTSAYGPCSDWPVRWTCDVSMRSPEVTGAAVGFATEILAALTGRQFGTCDVALRPCRRACTEFPFPDANWTQWPGGWTWPQPALIGGLWFNLTCGSCHGDCTCTELSEVLLPAPVHQIVQVRVDGSPLPTGSYHVLNHRRLVRTDGGTWPHCNDLSVGDDQVGGWSVTASFGQEPPSGADVAVGELACEVIRALSGEDCRLPRQVTSLARQGVTISFPDVSEMFKEGRTGLYLVDMFITAWNPNGLKRRAKTYSIDQPTIPRIT